MLLSTVKMEGVGTNPRIYLNGVIMAYVHPHYYYLIEPDLTGPPVINPWSKPFAEMQPCFDEAAEIERIKKDKLKPKGKRR